MYALVTDQGTAASETALCDRHYQNRFAVRKARQDAATDVLLSAMFEATDGSGPYTAAAPFKHIDDNPELHCIICGRRG